MRYLERRATLAAIAVLFVFSISANPGRSQSAPVTIIVNGQPVNFDQPPVERAGRVFVPLRGVFEQLGASVVYANGQINATGNGREISLNVGSTQATVNGQPQYLDVAPFLIGARTLVPLRFVAQALGAAVAWNQNTNTVHINGGNTAYNPQPPNNRPYPGGPGPAFALYDKSPDGLADSERPTLRAHFTLPVQLNTVRIRVDGMDISNSSSVDPHGFYAHLDYPLQPGPHHVRVSGLTQNGAPFSSGWSFNAP